jgi:hypothetical protein
MDGARVARSRCRLILYSQNDVLAGNRSGVGSTRLSVQKRPFPDRARHYVQNIALRLVDGLRPVDTVSGLALLVVRARPEGLAAPV